MLAASPILLLKDLAVRAAFPFLIRPDNCAPLLCETCTSITREPVHYLYLYNPIRGRQSTARARAHLANEYCPQVRWKAQLVKLQERKRIQYQSNCPACCAGHAGESILSLERPVVHCALLSTPRSTGESKCKAGRTKTNDRKRSWDDTTTGKGSRAKDRLLFLDPHDGISNCALLSCHHIGQGRGQGRGQGLIGGGIRRRESLLVEETRPAHRQK